MRRIVLASKSLDRRKLFNLAKINFEVLETDVDEEQFKKEINDPIQLVKKLAEEKALSAKLILNSNNTDAIIIAADTIVELNNEIIGKAKNENHAFEILKKLSNTTHNLITGFAITDTDKPKIIVDYDITSVKFLSLSENDIRDYIKSNEWKGRAGAYSIRERASLFIKSVNGSISNVIGLPMQKIYVILKNEFSLNLLGI
ncbi:MAG: Maf family protein [Promethearchaeota archaeon]|jgi:septum formation protein